MATNWEKNVIDAGSRAKDSINRQMRTLGSSSIKSMVAAALEAGYFSVTMLHGVPLTDNEDLDDALGDLIDGCKKLRDWLRKN